MSHSHSARLETIRFSYELFDYLVAVAGGEVAGVVGGRAGRVGKKGRAPVARVVARVAILAHQLDVDGLARGRAHALRLKHDLRARDELVGLAQDLHELARVVDVAHAAGADEHRVHRTEFHAGHHFERFDVGQGLPSTYASPVLEDLEGDVWVGT